MRFRIAAMMASTSTSFALISKVMAEVPSSTPHPVPPHVGGGERGRPCGSASLGAGHGRARRRVNDEDDGQGPESHIHEEGAVGEKQVGGAAPLVSLMHEVKIAEDAVEHERDRPGQAVGPVLLHRLRGHGVEGVAMRQEAVTTEIIWSSRYGLYSARMGRWPEAASLSEVSSWRRLARARKSASRIVHTISQSLNCTEIASAPATPRSRKPILIESTSTITISFSRNE